jgi:hypothetical protein
VGFEPGARLLGCPRASGRFRISGKDPARQSLASTPAGRPRALPTTGRHRRCSAVLGSDGWSVERTGKLHPLWQGFCSGGSAWWRRRSEGTLALGLIAPAGQVRRCADGHKTSAGGSCSSQTAMGWLVSAGAPWRADWRSHGAGHQSQERQSYSQTQPHPRSRHSRHSVECAVSEPRSLRGWVAPGVDSPAQLPAEAVRPFSRECSRATEAMGNHGSPRSSDLMRDASEPADS